MSHKILNVYLVSDSSGETAAAISEAAVSQFSNLQVIEYMWPLIRNIEQVDVMLAAVLEKPGIIISTMIDSPARTYLLHRCAELQLICLMPIDGLLEQISEYIQELPTKNTPGKNSHRLDDKSYHDKISAIAFTMQHDDGKHFYNYNDADIIILGLSRTSKSPLSLYLAYRGYKVANLPIILECPDQVSNLGIFSHPLIVGLTIDPHVLCKIRTSRMDNLYNMAITKNPKIVSNKDMKEHYYSIDAVRQELKFAHNLYASLKIPVINIGQKAIEEAAAEIIMHFFNKKGERIYNIQDL